MAGRGCRIGSENVSCNPIRILIADDHAVVRAGFSAVCEEAGLAVVGLAKNDEEVLQILRGLVVDVLLLDVRIDPFTQVGDLIRRFGCRARVIALSSFEPDDLVCRAVEAGAAGFLLKDSSRSHIVETIEAVYVNEDSLPTWVHARIAEKRSRPSLSRRELEVLEMVSKGLTNKEIAHVFQVSHFTVRNHVRRIIDKLEVGGRTEAATVAIQQGILSSYASC
jgi:DNA-binding NarL/FixJ family response regulator